MGHGETFCQNRRKDDIVGNNLPDAFMDSFQEEALVCSDIIVLCNMALTKSVRVIIDKDFLRKLVKSHIKFIKEMEREFADRHPASRKNREALTS